jgi:tetratricopeptide (TPR) repeat protein
MGTAYTEIGRYDEAEESFSLALQIRPNDENILFQMAESCARGCRYAQAIRAYQLALSFMPRHARARFGLGCLFVRLHKKNMALSH